MVGLNFKVPLKIRSNYSLYLMFGAQVASSQKVIEALLNAKADVNAADNFGATPLFVAAIRGNENAARQLLASPGIKLQV